MLWKRRFDGFVILVFMLWTVKMSLMCSIKLCILVAFDPTWLHKSWIFMFLFEKFSSMYLRKCLLIDKSLFWRIISNANLSCSILSVMLRKDEGDLDRILVFFIIFFSCGMSGISILEKRDMGDSGDEGHVDLGAGLFLTIYDSDMFVKFMFSVFVASW